MAHSQTHFSTDLDRDSPEPLYQQLACLFEAEIRADRLHAGARLEPEFAIAERFSISRVTVRLAIGELVRRRLVVRKQGKGTFVLQPAVRHNLRRSHGLLDSLFAQSGKARVELIRYELQVPPADIRDVMGLAAGEHALALDRLYYVDTKPVGLGEDWLIAEAATVPHATASVMSTENILRQIGVSLAHSETSFAAEAAGAVQRRHLNVAARSPILVLRRAAYGQDGKVKEIGRLSFCTDRYEFFFSTQDQEVGSSHLSIRSVKEVQ